MVAINTRGIARLALSSYGVPGNSSSNTAAMSADGRFVVFLSDASNLAPGDSNASSDIFLRDTLTGTTIPISIGPDGSFGNGSSSFSPFVSDDGRFVAFNSPATNLIPNDAKGATDIYLRDTLAGTTIRISENADGNPSEIDSSLGAMSGDGRFVAFTTAWPALVAGDANGSVDVFVKDTLTNAVTLVSVSSAEVQGNAASSGSLDISQDGRFVAFGSAASNLVAGDSNGARDIFLRDTALGTTTRISVSSTEQQANSSSFSPVLSDDGRFVAFSSSASNLVAGDTNGANDIFLRDTVAGTTKLVSATSTGVRGDSNSSAPDISADGRYVVFESFATNLVAGDTIGSGDVFLRDTVAGTTTRLSVGLGGVQGNGDSFDARISADGHYVTFTSDATNLVPGDTNGARDVFRVSLVASDSADYLIGSDGADVIKGLDGSDIIDASAGNDTIDGGRGVDQMSGGLGNDIYYVDNSGDTIVGETGGTDLVRASVIFSLAGKPIENLQLTGSASIAATGNSGGNTLTGNSGNNILYGIGGRDVLTGGAGADTFLFRALADSTVASTGRDTIQDFSHAQGDHIDVSIIDAVTGAGNQSFTFIGAAAFGHHAGELRSVISGGHTLISGDANGDGTADFSILLARAITLHADDFIL